MPVKRLLLSCLVVISMGALLSAKFQEKPPASGTQMAESARQFLDTLTETQREQATFDYHDPERLNWHFIPRERKGVPLRDLRGGSLDAAYKLVASGLSDAGYGQALDVMSLEEVLYLLEGGDRAARRERRHPKKYYLSIFGTPSSRGTWGWRVEGHHLSLNYTITDGQVAASTPEFFGANPALVDAGPGRSIRVLGTEEDLARQILHLCTPEQEKLAWISKTAPDDLRGGGKPQPEQTEPVGLPVSKMSDDQKQLMRELLSEYLRNMPADVERERRDRINAAGIDGIHFAWWGDKERNQRHYYRVQGPTFLIEYNNTQNNANHVHSMWRNLSGDFNIPIGQAK